jgi:hypothetical protein
MTAFPLYRDPVDPFYPIQINVNYGNDVLNVVGAWNKYEKGKRREQERERVFTIYVQISRLWGWYSSGNRG